MKRQVVAVGVKILRLERVYLNVVSEAFLNFFAR